MNIYLITLFSPPSCPITLWWIHEIIIVVLTIATSHSAEMGTYQIVMVENVNARRSAKTLAACNAYVWHLKHLICKFGCHIVQPVCHTVLYAEWQHAVCSHSICHTVLYAEWQQAVCSYSICHMNILPRWQQAHFKCAVVAIQCTWLLNAH